MSLQQENFVLNFKMNQHFKYFSPGVFNQLKTQFHIENYSFPWHWVLNQIETQLDSQSADCFPLSKFLHFLKLQPSFNSLKFLLFFWPHKIPLGLDTFRVIQKKIFGPGFGFSVKIMKCRQDTFRKNLFIFEACIKIWAGSHYLKEVRILLQCKKNNRQKILFKIKWI